MNINIQGLALGAQETESLSAVQNTAISALRLSQDYEGMVEVTRVVTTVSIGKPNRQTFFRVHGDWAAYYPIFAKKQDGERDDLYIVDTKAVPELAPDVAPRLLVPVITRAGGLYIWALRIGTPEKEADRAAKSAYAAMQKAKTSWVRINWNGREFECFAAKSKLSEPEWPDITFDQMLELAFHDRIIESQEHPVVKALRGEC